VVAFKCRPRICMEWACAALELAKRPSWISIFRINFHAFTFPKVGFKLTTVINAVIYNFFRSGAPMCQTMLPCHEKKTCPVVT